MLASAAAAGQSRLASPLMALLEAMDANLDGTVTSAEVVEFRANLFELLDADGDGFVTRTEREAARSARGGDAASAVGARRGRGGDLQRLDQDGDGRLSRAEFVERSTEALFERLDANADGVITPDEVPTRRRPFGLRG